MAKKPSPAELLAAVAAEPKPSQVDMALATMDDATADEWRRIMLGRQYPRAQIARALTSGTGVRVGADSVKTWLNRNE